MSDDEKYYGHWDGGIDVYEIIMDSAYPCECDRCNHLWASRGEGKCPECGSTFIGVSRDLPPGTAFVSEDEDDVDV